MTKTVVDRPAMLFTVTMQVEASVGDLWGVFHAGHISTPLEDAFTVGQNDSGPIAHRQLEEYRFDQAPVLFQGHVVGWVATEHLREASTVKSVMKRLDKSAIVSAEASMAGTLQLLGQHRFVFTAGESGLSGFIVPSDLDRHAARSYFYLLIAGIEILLSKIVEASTPVASIVGAMSPEMAQRYSEARAAASEADPVEYLYLEELVNLFLESAYAADLRVWDGRCKSRLIEINRFRSIVMHPTRSIVAARSPAQLAALARDSMDVLMRLQTIIDGSYT
jgi:hypothetical protein